MTTTGTAVRLYEVADSFIRAVAELTERDDLPAEVIADTLDAVHGELVVKATNVAGFIRNVEIEAGELAARAKDMQARAKRAQALADGMKAYLTSHLLRCDVHEVKHEGLRVVLVRNPPAVQIVNEKLVPEEFKREPPPAPPPPRLPDKKAIAEALKVGVPVEGCELIQSWRVKIEG
jgi:Siphovirus Gp157